MHALEVQNLSKSYRQQYFSKPKNVLHNISFVVPRRSITGFLGINGAGKSTTIKCVLDIVIPDAGDVFLFGETVQVAKNKNRVAYLPEKPQLYDFLSGQEFLSFCLRLSGLSRFEISKRVDEYLEMVDLKHAKKQRLREYSKGMYQRIGLAQALARESDFIILDEPMSDLDPEGRLLVKKIISNIHEIKKISIFMSTHLLQDVEDLCQNIVILDKGHSVYSGGTREFVENLQPTYDISYVENDFVKKMNVQKNELQEKIDFIRNQKKQILEVQNKTNLETAFHHFIGTKK